MNLFIEFLPFIPIVAFFLFLIYALFRTFSAQKTIMKHHAVAIDRQEQAIKLMEETNRLLSKILAAVKK